jgi:hypothetical protein
MQRVAVLRSQTKELTVSDSQVARAKTRAWQPLAWLQQALALVFVTSVGLCGVGGLGAAAALRSGFMPRFDLLLTMDGRNALVIQDLPCTPDVRVQHTCKDGGLKRREFKLIYRIPRADYVLLTFELPD